jgi:hypothetical protein
MHVCMGVCMCVYTHHIPWLTALYACSSYQSCPDNATDDDDDDNDADDAAAADDDGSEDRRLCVLLLYSRFKTTSVLLYAG